MDPEVGRSLQSVLDYDGDDLEVCRVLVALPPCLAVARLSSSPPLRVQTVFCLDFTASFESFGETVKHDLKPNGENIPVTQSNKREFLQLYTEWCVACRRLLVCVAVGEPVTSSRHHGCCTGS